MLRHPAPLLASVIESVDAGIVLLGPEAEVLVWNPWMERSSGIGSDRAVGKPLRELFPEIRGRRLEFAIREALRRGMASTLSPGLHPPCLPLRGGSLEHRGRDRMDQFITVKALEVAGAARCCMLQVTDVTRSLQREAILREQAIRLRTLTRELDARASDLARSNDELQQFANVASHDLQEPLRMVTSFVQLLERRYAGVLDEEGRRYIAFAVDGAARMKRLIADLLALARIGRRDAPALTDANASLQEVLGDLREAIDESGARISCDSLPVLRIDRTHLRQLLQNLLCNAIKYRSEDGPEIRIGCERFGDQWKLFVRDDGIGMAPDESERIFAVFQRLHSRSEYPGTGIGLALCRKIVDRNGGRIWVESAPGRGSTFFFTLPAATPEESGHVSDADPARKQEP